MANHTPGPWELGDETNNHAQVCLGSSGHSCDMNRWPDYPGLPEISRDEMRANARLIAAAPDLLAALKAVLDVGAADAAACEVTFGLCPETTHCPECDTRRAAIRMATTAIAKAEGRDRG